MTAPSLQSYELAMLTCVLTCEICAGRKRFLVYEEELAEVQRLF